VLWDTSSNKALRPLWGHLFAAAKGIVFVVDAADPLRFEEVREDVDDILRDEVVPDEVPVLFVANKQDLHGAHSPLAMQRELDLPKLVVGRPWNVVGCSSLHGDGVSESMAWICGHALEKRTMRVESAKVGCRALMAGRIGQE
jgi:GTP-binding protein SAR1